jgi:hypothetical protein
MEETTGEMEETTGETGETTGERPMWTTLRNG